MKRFCFSAFIILSLFACNSYAQAGAASAVGGAVKQEVVNENLKDTTVEKEAVNSPGSAIEKEAAYSNDHHIKRRYIFGGMMALVVVIVVLVTRRKKTKDGNPAA